MPQPETNSYLRRFHDLQSQLPHSRRDGLESFFLGWMAGIAASTEGQKRTVATEFETFLHRYESNPAELQQDCG